VKKDLWGGAFLTKGHFISAAGKAGNEKTISEYVKEQGRDTK
jgi:hypothetical protein